METFKPSRNKLVSTLSKAKHNFRREVSTLDSFTTTDLKRIVMKNPN
jgi:hypothetical protein